MGEEKKRSRPEEEENVNDGSDTDQEMEFDDGDVMATPSTPTKNGIPQANPVTPTLAPTSEKAAAPSEANFSPELLAQYYSRLFPFHLLHDWLSYDPKSLLPDSANKSTQLDHKLFSHREFSFTISLSGEDIYIRYQSFLHVKDLIAAIKSRNPHKIDIGAIFSHPPKDHHSLQGNSGSRKFQPTQRELVFDIDLTDYDGVRQCGCSGAKICGVCWKMMNMAVRVMDQGLKEDFGFEHVAWFYSGRRGVHAWVCDDSARQLTDAGRSAVANYFEVNLGTDKNKNVELYNPLHPTLERSYKILEPMFIQDIIPASGHGILANPEQWTELLSTLPESASAVADTLTKKWNKDDTTPSEKWTELKRYLDILMGKQSSKKTKQSKTMNFSDRNKIELWPVATVFQYCYPRLDINVSKMRNHLLKSPFCVHPKTGRVCVPINPEKVEDFDPFTVPTLPQLMRELDEYDEEKSGKVKHEWEKTSLKESFSHFQKEFMTPMWKQMKKVERSRAEERAALVGDF